MASRPDLRLAWLVALGVYAAAMTGLAAAHTPLVRALLPIVRAAIEILDPAIGVREIVLRQRANDTLVEATLEVAARRRGSHERVVFGERAYTSAARALLPLGCLFGVVMLVPWRSGSELARRIGAACGLAAVCVAIDLPSVLIAQAWSDVVRSIDARAGLVAAFGTAMARGGGAALGLVAGVVAVAVAAARREQRAPVA